MGRKQFNLIWVPQTVHDQIRYHESLCMKLGAATDPDEIQQLYSQLCYARKFLYEELESRCERREGEKLANLRFV